MVTETVLSFLLAATAARPILTPVSFDTANLARPDATVVAGLLVVHVYAIDRAALSQQQELVWDDLSRRILTEYSAADRRARAALTRDVLSLGGSVDARSEYSVWFRFPDGFVTHLERVSYPRSGVLWRACDVTSGQYMAIVTSGDASEMMRVIKELLAEPESSSARGRVGDEAAHLAENTEALVEVNGQRQWLSRGAASRGALAAEMVGLFPNLYDDGRTRLLQSLALAEAARTGNLKTTTSLLHTASSLCAAPVEAAALPLPAVPNTLQLRETGGRTIPALEAVDPGTVEAFFGKDEWVPPDLDLPFKDQVRKLLSGLR
jgi:hypothetical protein